jgi:hypothetical protein
LGGIFSICGPRCVPLLRMGGIVGLL